MIATTTSLTESSTDASLLAFAIGMASRVHGGHLDKAGQPVLLHVLRVGLGGQTDDERIVGFLHDVLEDSDTPHSSIATIFSDDIVQALAAISREPGEAYFAYIDRCAKNQLARKVKLRDLHDNMSRLHRLSVDEASSLGGRYLRAVSVLS